MPINRPKRVYVRIQDADREFPAKSLTIYGETPETAEAEIREHFDRKSEVAPASPQSDASKPEPITSEAR
jgi:hypothetical protein